MGPGQHESSADITTASASFFPPFSFNEDEDVVQMDVVGSNITHPQSRDNELNLSNISFNEITSPCNDYIAPQKRSNKSNLSKHNETYISNSSSQME